MRAPRSLNQQQEAAASSESVIPREVHSGVVQSKAWLLFPAESQQAALAAQPTAVVRLGLVHAQSTLCSSKRQSVLQVQSTLQVPVNFEPLADMQG